MTPAKRAQRVAQHIEELARDCVLSDYISKLAKTARDLEERAAELEGKTWPEATDVQKKVQAHRFWKVE